MRQIDRGTLHLEMEELFNDPCMRLTLNISGMRASDQTWLRTHDRDYGNRCAAEFGRMCPLRVLRA